MFITRWYHINSTNVWIFISIEIVEGYEAMTELPNDQHITYQLQYRKCGKSSCSTCRNGQGHGPYWYAYWREGTRLRSGYVGKTPPQPIEPSDIPSSSPAGKSTASNAVQDGAAAVPALL